MNQYGRKNKREPAVHDMTPENRIASALERIADCFESMLTLAEREIKNSREGQG